MKRVSTVFVVLFWAVGCGGAQDRPHSDLSTSEHYKAARRHDGVASGHEEAVKRNRERVGQSGIECIERPLAGMPTSGTETIRVMKPCWTRDEDPATVAHLRAARMQRFLAAKHRAKARALVVAERKACAGLGETAISRSPFWHREDIAAVTALKRGKTIIGVRVLFRKVGGLSAAWMKRSVACHRARAASLGFRTDFMAYCPLMLPDIRAKVSDSGAGIVVTITSKRSEMAAAALGRATYGDRIRKRQE